MSACADEAAFAVSLVGKDREDMVLPEISDPALLLLGHRHVNAIQKLPVSPVDETVLPVDILGAVKGIAGRS